MLIFLVAGVDFVEAAVEVRAAAIVCTVVAGGVVVGAAGGGWSMKYRSTLGPDVEVSRRCDAWKSGAPDGWENCQELAVLFSGGCASLEDLDF